MNIILPNSKIIKRILFAFNSNQGKMFHCLDSDGEHHRNILLNNCTISNKGVNEMTKQELNNLSKAELNNVIGAKYTVNQMKNIIKDQLVDEVFSVTEAKAKPAKKASGKKFNSKAFVLNKVETGATIEEIAKGLKENLPEKELDYLKLLSSSIISHQKNPKYTNNEPWKISKNPETGIYKKEN